MSKQYDEYLEEHRSNVIKGYMWLEEHLPQVITMRLHSDMITGLSKHDSSKFDQKEYDAYDAYFYGQKTPQVERDFNLAWLRHIHRNPHHWQHWVLITDDDSDVPIGLDMPYGCIIEMICDWWTFSWKTGNLYEIFSWYDSHKDRMILSKKTERTVEGILYKMYAKLEELKKEESKNVNN